VVEMSKGLAVKALEDTSLRTAQKSLTRSRIREAARNLFFSAGYAATTVEQIAAASGASRATFYLHFKDKEDVLREIARDYAPRAAAVMRRFPGPRPSLADIRAWAGELADMMADEQISLLILRQVGTSGAPLPDYVQDVSEQVLGALGEAIPALGAALQSKARGTEARVRAELLFTEATVVCGRAALGQDDFVAVALDVLAEHFAAFLQAPCFADLS
jgi:AcrR family transcriptional regulator